jgi:hypothetical protein
MNLMVAIWMKQNRIFKGMITTIDLSLKMMDMPSRLFGYFTRTNRTD